MSAQEGGSPSQEDVEESCEQAYPATLGLLGHFSVMGAGCVVVLDSGATANLACFRLLGRRNSIFKRGGSWLRSPILRGRD